MKTSEAPTQTVWELRLKVSFDSRRHHLCHLWEQRMLCPVEDANGQTDVTKQIRAFRKYATDVYVNYSH